jgi:hypothetical protein
MQRQNNKSGRNGRTQNLNTTIVSPQLQSQIARSINSALKQNLETKTCDASGSDSISYNGTMTSVTKNLLRGDSSINECQGILIKPQKLVFRSNISSNQTFSTVRVLLFQWKDASAPLPSGVLTHTGSVLAPHGQWYWVNNRKVAVLHDQTLALTQRSSGGNDNKMLSFEVNLVGVPAIQLPLTGAGLQPQMNGLYLLMISDDAITTYPVVNWTAQLTFTDA